MDLFLPSPSLGSSATSFLFRFFQRFNEFSKKPPLCTSPFPMFKSECLKLIPLPLLLVIEGGKSTPLSFF